MHEHKLARDDERAAWGAVTALTTVVVVVLSAATTAVIIAKPDTTQVSDWLWALAPLLPLGILAVLAAHLDEIGVRSQHLRHLEVRLAVHWKALSDREMFFGYTLIQPGGLVVVVWLIADVAGLALPSALVGYLISRINDDELRSAIAVLYGLAWVVVAAAYIRGLSYYFSPHRWLARAQAARQRSERNF